MWRAEVGGGLLYNISQVPGSRICSIALKYTNKLVLAHYLRKRDRLTLVLIHVMESDLACEAALFPSGASDSGHTLNSLPGLTHDQQDTVDP